MEDGIVYLTALITPGVNPDCFVGRVKEVSGIVSQGATITETYSNLKEVLPVMLKYKGIEGEWVLQLELGHDPLAGFNI